MKRLFSFNAIRFACAAALAASAAAAPRVAAEVILYDGDPTADTGIKVGGWGAGTAEESTDERLNNARSIKIKTRDFYQGARIDLPRPVELTEVLKQPNAYLALSLKLGMGPRQITVVVPASPAVGGGGMGLEGGGMEPGGIGGGGGVGTPGGATTVQLPKVTRLRAVFIGPKGTLEAYSHGEIEASHGAWTTVGVALAPLAEKIGQASFPVQRILIAANAPDTLFLGRMALVNDDTEITAEASAERYNDVKKNTPLRFTATAQAGVSAVRFSWDFDASDGIQEDAIGKEVKHTFASPNRYRVTLTATPIDGSTKKPVTQTLEVEVVP